MSIGEGFQIEIGDAKISKDSIFNVPMVDKSSMPYFKHNLVIDFKVKLGPVEKIVWLTKEAIKK